MISDAVSSIKDSFNDIMNETNDLAENEKNEINAITDKAKYTAKASKTTKQVWQS